MGKLGRSIAIASSDSDSSSAQFGDSSNVRNPYTYDSAGYVRVFDLNQEPPFLAFEHIIRDEHLRDIEFSVDGRFIAIAATDQQLRIISIANEKNCHFGNPLILSGHETDVASIAFSSDGQYLVTADVGGYVRLWNLQEELGTELRAAAPLAKGSISVKLDFGIMGLWTNLSHGLIATQSDSTLRLLKFRIDAANPAVYAFELPLAENAAFGFESADRYIAVQRSRDHIEALFLGYIDGRIVQRRVISLESSPPSWTNSMQRPLLALSGRSKVLAVSDGKEMFVLYRDDDRGDYSVSKSWSTKLTSSRLH